MVKGCGSVISLNFSLILRKILSLNAQGLTLCDSTNSRNITQNEKELNKLGRGRGTQIWSRVDLRHAVIAVLRVPGIRADFNISTLDEFLRYRKANVVPDWDLC